MSQRRTTQSRSYPRLRSLDGSHPFREAVPRSYVEYGARRRHDGEVAYFNFGLAREIGLIARSHPDRLPRELEKALLDAFCLRIINEYDCLHRTRIPAEDVLPRSYMATRYLQLQHRGRQGRTSGDGRSIWNGCVRGRGGVTWDVSSCGTGVTRLCPATAEQERFFRTGSRLASYGCGTATLEEGLSAALMSETFHQAGIATERVLAVIALPSGQAINVRAGRNLLRPSHLFAHLKQNDLTGLRAVTDLLIERQVDNGDWPALRRRAARYGFMAEEMARTFARVTARFESEYIFCWLDWDGDNILADGGIIDYGSVRQFGLYHREYRFEDVDRMSTTIPEQRRKARDIVQNFAQIRDFLLHGRKRRLERFARDPVLDLFDAEFEATRNRLLLHHVGLEPETAERMLARHEPAVLRLRRAHAYFERARAARGPRRAPDGITWNAIFSTRDLLRELPLRLAAELQPLPAAELIEIAASSYASRRDRALTPNRRRMAGELQRAYLQLIECAARERGTPARRLLAAVARRSARINQAARITGNGVDWATRRLIQNRRKLGPEGVYAVIQSFAGAQTPGSRPGRGRAPGRRRNAAAERVLQGLLAMVEEFREGL